MELVAVLPPNAEVLLTGLAEHFDDLPVARCVTEGVAADRDHITYPAQSVLEPSFS